MRFGSTSTVLDELDVESKALSSATGVKLSLPEELWEPLAEIAQLCEASDEADKPILFKSIRPQAKEGDSYRYTFNQSDALSYFKKSYQDASEIPIKHLVQILEALNYNQESIDLLSEKHIAAIEAYRLAIMRAVYDKLDSMPTGNATTKRRHTLPNRVIEVEEEEGTKIYNWVKKHFPRLRLVFFGILFIIGMVLDFLYNFSGFTEILQLATFITSPVLLGITIGLTAFNLILYVAFEGTFLAEMFDIRPRADERKKLEAWEEQMNVGDKINTLLNAKTIPSEERKLYLAVERQCNITDKHRQLSFRDCNETTFRKWARRILTVLGGILAVGSASFGAMTLLPLLPVLIPFLAPVFLNPIGAGIFVGIVILTTFISYFSMQGKGIATLLSPNLDKKKEIRLKLNAYRERIVHDHEFQSAPCPPLSVADEHTLTSVKGVPYLDGPNDESEALANQEFKSSSR